MRHLLGINIVLTQVIASTVVIGAEPTLKRAVAFDSDPQWEGWNNRVVPAKFQHVVQDFGRSSTKFTGGAKGEMGGLVTRANRPAYYADAIPAKTLRDRLSARGTFALTKSSPAGGIFFGWFRAEQPGGGGRPVGSLGINLDTEHSGGRLAVRLIADTNRATGTFITPYVPGKYRPTPIKNDGTRYRFALDYDPTANDGLGRFEFTLTSDSPQPEEFEGKKFVVDLPPGLKDEGATFDRFGLMNMMKSGGHVSMYFGELSYDGREADFTRDGTWVGSGNRTQYDDRETVGAHNFGYSPTTNFAGGKSPGEIGGGFWRSGDYGFYADRIGPLSLDDRLEARGRIVLAVGAPDSDMYLGWFSSTTKDKPPVEAGSFLGVHIGGPTRVGHYFHPAMTTAMPTRTLAEGGPVLVPGRSYPWSIVYDPEAESGRGAIHATLGEQAITFPFKREWKAQGAMFDRFGAFNSTIGGQLVKIYLDDLSYTAGRSK